MDLLDIIVRLGAAILIGGLIGLDRNLHHKPTGVRTLGLVALGSALAVLAVAHDRLADVSRVIQGVIMGVGFIGAGVILHHATSGKVHGMTTAASIWVTAPWVCCAAWQHGRCWLWRSPACCFFCWLVAPSRNGVRRHWELRRRWTLRSLNRFLAPSRISSSRPYACKSSLS